MNRFKKALCLLLVLGILPSLCGCLSGTSLSYTKAFHEGGFYFAENEKERCCFVSDYTCPDLFDGIVIDIPDEADGCPVTKLGGYYGRGLPMPFGIYAEKIGGNVAAEVSSIPDESTPVYDLTIHLRIGKNVREISHVQTPRYYSCEFPDGSTVFYRPVFYLECREENEIFETQDGVLIKIATGTVVPDFIYKN